MDHKELRGLLSDEHLSVDGTQIAAWASMKSFKAKDGSSDPPGLGRVDKPDPDANARQQHEGCKALDQLVVSGGDAT
jgi:hypothetical protein